MYIRRSERDSTRANTKKIELDHLYIMPMVLDNFFYIAVKQYIDKLLVVGFIQSVEEVTWLSPIIIIPKKNGKLRICLNFRKINVATKKDPYPLPFTNEMLNTIAWYDAFYFLDRYLGYHQISIFLEDKYKMTFVIHWGAFIWKVMSFGLKIRPPTY